ncbi:MAG TPA: ribonuclease D [Chloroflexia bacterium]|jgi:ribonuclease D
MDVLQATGAKCYQNDIPTGFMSAIYSAGAVAWDIETSGLDWKTGRIGTCQLYIPGDSAALVIMNDEVPSNLCVLLADPGVKKIFHHAMFDLRFMSHNWKVQPQNIACTKIAAKLLNPHNNDENSLKPLLKRYLGTVIDKTQQTSDWFSPRLSEAQIAYAITDVYYLPRLLLALEGQLSQLDLLELANMCFAHIPAQVHLDLLGYTDIYSY